MKQLFFNRTTSRLFQKMQRSSFSFHFYRTGSLGEAAFQRYNFLFVIGAHSPAIDFESESVEPLKFDLRCFLCRRCNVLQKRDNVRIYRSEFPQSFICKAACQPIIFDAIPEVISILTDDEKRALRLVKMYGWFCGPNFREYQRYLGTASFSANWNCWRDLSGLIGINNTYNRFEFINNERAIAALSCQYQNNPLYREFDFNEHQMEALIHLNDNRDHFARSDGTVFTALRNENQELAGTEDEIPPVLPLGEQVLPTFGEHN